MTVTTDIPTSTRSNTKTIGRNFAFMGLEVVIALVSTLTTTVFIARAIGPTRLGYFSLVMWLTNITCSVGSLGIPLTTFKYLGEFWGGGQKDLARATFFYNLRAQIVIAVALTFLSMIAVLTLADSQYRLCSALLVLSMVPNMVTFVPSQMNTVVGNSAVNTKGALVAAIVYISVVGLSLLLGWDLVGIAVGVLLNRTAELVVKILPALKSMAGVPRVPLPMDIRKRMFTFSGLSTGLMVLQIVVWDRSDVIFLKLLQSDIRQLAFFSVCFSVADRLMRMPQSFANAFSATQVAEYGRNKDNLYKITSQAFMYVLMGALPILVGIACIGSPFVRVIYGPQYLPAIPVLVVVVLFSIPKAVLTPAFTLLYAAEDLEFVLKCGCVAGLADIVLDIALIPRHGATGAAFANGIAQTLAAVAIWLRVLSRYPVSIDTPALLRLTAAILAMAAAVIMVVAMPLGSVLKLITAIPTGVFVFVFTSRLFMVLQKEDRRRLLVLSTSVPLPVRTWFTGLVNFLVPLSPIAELSR